MKTANFKIGNFLALIIIITFLYDSISKVVDYKNFQLQLEYSPLLNSYSGFISYGVIITELFIVGLLIIGTTRLLGFIASFVLLMAFILYIVFILFYAQNLPCTCIGLFDKMTWNDNLLINIGLLITAFSGILVQRN